MPFSSDLSAVFLSDFALQATLGTATAPCIFDVQDVVEQDASGYGVQSRRQSALVKAGALGSVTQDSTITIGGTAFTVHRSEPEPPDFALERIILAG